jgi:D-beta-D-heptose 7-phosphate kinase/D-beta-D-heptose 1-phosphate adenosyltransferase
VSISIPEFSNAHVVVVGDVMLDRYLFGATGRISPEAPVPVVHVRRTDDRPGGAANVAVNLATLGVRTTLLGIVGDDDEAIALESKLVDTGVSCLFAKIADWPTITKTRVQSRGQQLIRLDREEPITSGSDKLVETLKGLLADANAVVMSDYGKGSLTEVAAMIAECREAGVPVFVDPKGNDFAKYRGATLITPNQGEFDAAAGQSTTDDELLTNGRQLMHDLDLAALLVTRSEKGMLLLEDNGESEFLSTRAREVFDVTGAGDTVIATLAAALANGQTLKSAAQLANLAAGLVVGKIGVAAVTPSELRVALHRLGQGGRGLVLLDELRSMVEEARSRGDKIVMTNGCFDVLHAGHVAYLEEAKSLGDRLIVAINDDDSVRRLKGDPRPINALADRMAVISGLAAVDWVVSFADDTPQAAIQSILPDVLVKGGDYRLDDIIGSKEVLKNGGEVRVLAFREGHSSSRIIERLKS